MSTEKFGIVAAFDTPYDVYHAAEKVRDAGFTKWDIHTPFPVHGLPHAQGLKRSKVPMFTLAGGVLGFVTGMLMAWYMGAYDYPLIVGGKPYFSPIFPFPVAYELTILLAAFGTFFGMFITNMLPQHYHPVMNYPGWARVMDDKFIIVIETKDPKYNTEETRKMLEELGGKDIVEVDQ